MEQDESPFDMEKARSELLQYVLRLIVWLILCAAYVIMTKANMDDRGVSDLLTYGFILCACVCAIFVPTNIGRIYRTWKQIKKHTVGNKVRPGDRS